MRLYYVENNTMLSSKAIEKFYMLDTGYGVWLEMHSETDLIPYKSFKEFKNTWRKDYFKKHVVMVRVL